MIKSWKDTKMLSCFGNAFSAETRISFLSNEFSTPASVPYIHSEYSFIFPFKAFPNNMTTFSCALTEPYVWRTRTRRLSVSLRSMFHNMGTCLRQLLKVCWPDSVLCETLQMGSHTLSCPNDQHYHQNHK